LPADITEAKIKTIFGPYGTIKGAKMMGKGSCVLWLGDATEAERMVENLDGNCVGGLLEPIKCAFPKAGIHKYIYIYTYTVRVALYIGIPVYKVKV